jgi:Domain of unknown function (DUF4082)
MIRYSKALLCGAAAVIAFVPGKASMAQNVLAVDATSLNTYQPAFALSMGWEFQTTHDLTLTALDAYDPSLSGNVRIYDASGNVVASAGVTATDPLVGSAGFHSHALTTPITLSAGTWYIAQDIPAGETVLVGADIVNSPEVTYLSSLVGSGLGGTPTTDLFGGVFAPGIFGPNFE